MNAGDACSGGPSGVGLSSCAGTVASRRARLGRTEVRQAKRAGAEEASMLPPNPVETWTYHLNRPTCIAGRTGAVTTFALCATAARALHTRMMRHSHTHMPAPPALSPQSGFARARTPHSLCRARGRRSSRPPRSTCASWCVDATATGRLADRARCVPVARVQCSCTQRAFVFACTPHHIHSYILRAGDAAAHERRGR